MTASRADYESAVYWIIRHRGQMGGWPPGDVAKVSGWLVTKFTAALFHKPVNQVAQDIIEHAQHADGK